MNKRPIIRKGIAVLMLMLFAVTITPRQLFHDVITGHKHSYVKLVGTQDFNPSKAGFQCNWNNDLIDSAFNDPVVFQLDHPVVHHSSEFNRYILNYYSAVHYFSSLRGPPSLS